MQIPALKVLAAWQGRQNTGALTKLTTFLWSKERSVSQPGTYVESKACTKRVPWILPESAERFAPRR